MLIGINILVILAVNLSGCEEDEIRKRQSRPSEDGSETPGFVLETIESVEAKKAATINIGDTILRIPIECRQWRDRNESAGYSIGCSSNCGLIGKY